MLTLAATAGQRSFAYRRLDLKVESRLKNGTGTIIVSECGSDGFPVSKAIHDLPATPLSYGCYLSQVKPVLSKAAKSRDGLK
jgi:hypothetical protein